MLLDLDKISNEVQSSLPYKRIGKITGNMGGVFEVSLARANLGASVDFITESGEKTEGEVVGIRQNRCLAMPYKTINGINSETQVILKGLNTEIEISDGIIGRIVDFKAEPIDEKGMIRGKTESRDIFGDSINPLHRPTISEPLDTGVRAINCFTTIGKGQRIAILAGSGVGKSVLLSMIARNTKADINVIALIGERGREVLEFIKNDLGEEGLENSVVVVATSDASALIRNKAAYTATTIAEYFRDQGKDVLLMMDSITRFAMANREISLSAGEPPGQKGYTPSVFAKLPKLLERAGTKQGAGSITGIYTVLVEGGDLDEPVTDAVRSISDGHIVLSRELASRNHYPAIDILGSISRVMGKVITPEHKIVASHLRDLFAAYIENEDLINVGAYAKGTNPKVDKAIAIYPDFIELLRQDMDETSDISNVFESMVEIARKAEMSINPQAFAEE
jgi:flagellum-specific ATP synthase